VKCPDQECRDTVIKLGAVVKIIGIIVCLVVGSITTVGLYGLAAEKKQNDKIAEIPVIQKDIQYIKENMAKMQENVDSINKKMGKQINRDDLDRLIKAVRKSTR